MDRFSVAESRRLLTGPDGLALLRLSYDFERAKRRHALTSCAWSFLNSGAECILAGLDDLADQVLQKARTWLTAAIELPEESSWADGHPQGRRFANLALCHWLLSNRHDAASLGRAIQFLEAGLTTSPPEDNSRTVGFNMLMWVCLEAGDYAQIERLCHQHGRNPLPSADRLIGAEADGGAFCRVLARHQVGIDYTAEEIAAFVGGFTRAFVRYLLEGFQFDSVARLMKILHWRGENTPPTARDAVRMCLTEEYA
jgi:hypothetical protein